jgi:hypothetical protein
MTSLTALLSKWPLIRQIRERTYGTGLKVMSNKTRAMHARIDDAQVARSICPTAALGAVFRPDSASSSFIFARCAH